MVRPLDGYPTSWGSSRASVFPTAGPSSYPQITYGPLANGDTVQAGPEAGLKYFDFLAGGASDSGNYYVIPVPVNPSGGPVGQPSTTWRLKWMALRTATLGGQNQIVNTEAIGTTDLSGETVRLLGVGPK